LCWQVGGGRSRLGTLQTCACAGFARAKGQQTLFLCSPGVGFHSRIDRGDAFVQKCALKSIQRGVDREAALTGKLCGTGTGGSDKDQLRFQLPAHIFQSVEIHWLAECLALLGQNNGDLLSSLQLLSADSSQDLLSAIPGLNMENANVRVARVAWTQQF
jgi:hypothetical protein